MRRRRRRFIKPMNLESFTDRSVKRSILEYTYNIVSSVSIDTHILNQAFSCLSIKCRENIVNNIYTDKKADHPVPDNVFNNYEETLEELDDPSSLADTVIRNLMKKKVPAGMSGLKMELLKELQRELSYISSAESPFDRRLDILASAFALSYADISVLKLVHLAFSTSNDSLNNIFNDRSYDSFIRAASIATGLTSLEIKKSLNKSGILVSTGIIEALDASGQGFISVDSSIDEFLTGIAGKNVIEKYVRADRGRRLKTESFSIPDEDVKIMKDILSSGSPCNILLYGIPGTGKTEFARSIASQCAENVYMLRYGENDLGSRGNRNADSDSRRLALRIGINTVTENGGILIADEADFLLNTSMWSFDNNKPEKGWLNDLLDNSKARIIWITNKTGSMEESTLRRFSYSLHFKRFSKKQRIEIWNNILKRSPFKKMITPDIIADLSARYEVNAGGISSTINSLKQILHTRELKPEEVKPVLENLLSRHSKLTGKGINRKAKLVDLTEKYDLSFLNTDTDISKVVKSVKRVSEMQIDEDKKNNINLLLWGESGTGKTEFAKYLASETGKGLIIKRASDLMNMYVGETEKLIREAFLEAESEKSILFIDEADTFFGSRERANTSWEVSHTNEFLVQMENFSGILICCTNLLDIFDTAAMRRFNWKVKFNPVLPEKRVPLYEKYFMDNASPLSEKQKKRITGIENLTPGHAKAVHQRLFFIPDETCEHDLIITELEKEASFLKLRAPKKTGFSL
ncbi:MAG TPA: ATP-binding protein [Spirochaetota bacterium]|nr:ATP-binding protein [Spirochaetota bacterium]